ncbi:estradiol 17beta-dehydrogenase protein [Halorhabdus tiamatea SARL4B]|uniref:Estradiol 17beta-dehydrogenase protein n=2 Tax=Halorhabdus tiamatea SARL4B TaxID=1033806 RepID=U2DZD3_9EURY|nr:SDR family NAD(P)-dependent oxidoreductase [Halorhabdus tiamatea]ERJ05488.1 estradiol 17beta-dehydrogenase protein [Halorhabdus tiamatea SARL4B]
MAPTTGSETDGPVWFVTGASRGMGREFARAALDAGHAVVATGRDTDAVAEAVGESENLLVAELDVTKLDDAESAAQAAVDRFGRIDVLVNNAGISYKGFFEEMTTEEIKHQLEVNFFGQLYVTRAVLPVMRDQRSGHIIAISSGAGLSGFGFSSAYAASKHALEGWMDALHDEVAPVGIDTTIVNPGWFRTTLTSAESMPFTEPAIDDYDERRAEQMEWWNEQGGQQPNDPARLAEALVEIAGEDDPPRRFIAGEDAIELAEETIDRLQNQIDAYRELSTSMAYDA